MMYSIVQGLITKYHPELLPLFADNWERWPAYEPAFTIAADLKKSADQYEKMGILDDVKNLRRAAIQLQNCAILEELNK